MSLESALGNLLRRVRAGERHLVWKDTGLAAPRVFSLSSPNFADDGIMPRRCAARGIGDNVSPALRWDGVPPTAGELALVVQDPDVPLPWPISHLIAFGIDPGAGGLSEGALEAGGPEEVLLGKGSFGRVGYQGPRPVAGHGPHRYVFQMFALARPIRFERPPDLSAIVAAMSGAVIARARLVGSYERP